MSDNIIEFCGSVGSKKYPDKLRIVEYKDKESDKVYTFITNNFKLFASTIAEIYLQRWQIELFFK